MREFATPKSKRTYEELLAAADRVFVAKGYFETRVADIAANAGVSHGSFYSYFDSKDDVLALIIGQMVEGLLTASGMAVSPAATPYLTLEATIRQFLRAYQERSGLIGVLEQAVTIKPKFREQRQLIRSQFGIRLERIISRQQSAHQHPDGVVLDPAIAAQALGGMVDDFARACYLLGRHVPESVASETLATIWARAVGLPIVREGSEN